MKLRRWIPGVLFLVLALAAMAGVVATRERRAPVTEGSGATPANRGANVPGRPHHLRQVDTRPLLTARRLLALAATPEEQELAHQAEKLAEHAVDLTFADALRQAAEEAPDESPEMKARLAARQKAQAAVDADAARVKQLTAQMASAHGLAEAGLQEQLEVARAQQELDQDELDMASESVERAGGDPQAEVKRLKALHDATQQEVRPTNVPGAAGAVLSPAENLVARAGVYSGLRDKRVQLDEAEQDAKDRVLRLTQRRSTVLERVQKAEQAREAAKRSATGFAERASGGGEAAKQEARTAVEALKQFTEDQRRVTTLGQRIQDEQALADVYGSWRAIVEGYARAALHRVLQALLGIALVLVVTFLAVRLVDRLYEGVAREQLRAGTLRSVVKFAVQAVGALVVLFIVIGVPGQATTILGLAGAGLTVAMKDFIVAFFGWFVLMSKNGIRVGDWVEIEGVGGEVVEIGLFHTVLLETGAWIDAGHPTGRRVSFVNSFAIEGHYFNFSTSGQWMWDEVRLLVPLGQDPYPILDRVRKLVEEETAANARVAEQEWSASSGYRVKSFSAAPGLTVVPTAAGVEIHVRYITRAPDRHESRRRLYQEVVALLHSKHVQGADAA